MEYKYFLLYYCINKPQNSMRSFKTILAALILFTASSAISQSLIDTTWHGDINLMGSKLGIIIEFWSEGGLSKGTIDIPQQKAEGLALTGIVFQNPKIHFELQAGPGLAVFEGIYYIDSIAGTFSQAGMQGTFSMKKGLPEKTEVTVRTDLPYKEEEVSFTNGENTFAGTFTKPLENKSG